jgi:hypothetical protein
MDEPNELDPLFVSDVGLHERFSGHVCCTREKSGAPSFAFFAKGGIPRPFDRDSFIPPFAKNAKDGAPGDLLHFLPRTRNAPFHIPRVGNAGE